MSPPLNLEADIAVDTPGARTGIKAESIQIRLTDVRFAWRPGEPDIISIDEFSVTKGERLFIVGPSGSGKSTLLSLLGGVVVPRAGRVDVLDRNLPAMPGWRRDRFRADHVGFVFQMFNLVPYLSIVDNVTLPCRFSPRRRARSEARSSSIRADAMRLLAELELDRSELLDRAVVDLSIGQQQRVAMARALIDAPEIVIADEGTRERFLELLFNECDTDDTTLLFVSHDNRLGGLFDRRVSLKEINRSVVEAVS